MNVWCGILGNRIIGPVFFDGNLTGQAYLRFLQEDLGPLLEDIPLEIRRNMWFQHDYSRSVRDGFREGGLGEVTDTLLFLGQRAHLT